MKVLLDTHSMLWWWTDPGRFRKPTLATLSDPETIVLVSAISAYELAYKQHCGKLTLPAGLLANFAQVVADENWVELAVTSAHTLLAGQLPSVHCDPFDRLLAAQALTESAWMATVDPAFETFTGLRVLW